MVFCWDIDVPEAKRPLDGKRNIDVIRENLDLLFGADLKSGNYTGMKARQKITRGFEAQRQ